MQDEYSIRQHGLVLYHSSVVQSSRVERIQDATSAQPAPPGSLAHHTAGNTNAFSLSKQQQQQQQCQTTSIELRAGGMRGLVCGGHCHRPLLIGEGS